MKPEFPYTRVIVEGTIGTCPVCGSTEKKKYYFFGRKIGCYNKKCPNYFYSLRYIRKKKLKKLKWSFIKK